MFMEPAHSLKHHIFAFSHDSSASHPPFGVFALVSAAQPLNVAGDHSQLGFSTMSQKGKGNFSRATSQGQLLSFNESINELEF